MTVSLYRATIDCEADCIGGGNGEADCIGE